MAPTPSFLDPLLYDRVTRLSSPSHSVCTKLSEMLEVYMTSSSTLYRRSQYVLPPYYMYQCTPELLLLQQKMEAKYIPIHIDSNSITVWNSAAPYRAYRERIEIIHPKGRE